MIILFFKFLASLFYVLSTAALYCVVWHVGEFYLFLSEEWKKGASMKVKITELSIFTVFLIVSFVLMQWNGMFFREFV